MSAKRYLTVQQVATYLGTSKQRIIAKIDKNHYPNHKWCECGSCILIPVSDLDLDTPDRRKTRHKRKENEKQ